MIQGCPPWKHGMENLEVIRCAQVHVFVAHGGELPWGSKREIIHSDLRQLGQICQRWVTVSASLCGISKVEVHVSSDLGYLRRSQTSRGRDNKYFGPAAEDELTPPRFLELSPNGGHPRIIHRVVF